MGTIYDGEWVDGRREEQASSSASGDKYVGEFVGNAREFRVLIRVDRNAVGSYGISLRPLGRKKHGKGLWSSETGLRRWRVRIDPWQGSVPIKRTASLATFSEHTHWHRNVVRLWRYL